MERITEYHRCRAALRAAFLPDLPEEYLDFVADHVADAYVRAHAEAKRLFEPELTTQLRVEKTLSATKDFDEFTLQWALHAAAMIAEKGRRGTDAYVFSASRDGEQIWLASRYANSYEGCEDEEPMWSYRVTPTRQVWNSGVQVMDEESRAIIRQLEGQSA